MKKIKTVQSQSPGTALGSLSVKGLMQLLEVLVELGPCGMGGDPRKAAEMGAQQRGGPQKVLSH